MNSLKNTFLKIKTIMKKRLIFLIKILTGIVLLIIMILFFSIESIDTAPYFESEYYKNTIKKMDKQVSDIKTSKGQLLAGFSSINITPTIVIENENPTNGAFNKIKLAGFGDGKIATGVHDSLFAKAIALDVNGKMVVMVSADLLLMPESVVEGVEKELKSKSDILRTQIIYGATHTHASIGNFIPGLIGKSFGGEFQPQLVEWLSKKFAKVIIDAILDIKPAQIAIGSKNIPNLIRNRIIGETGRLNDKLSVISIKQNSGRQAVIGVFAAHATTISAWNDQFSGDYPGYFQRYLENNGIDMAMFYAGTTGSHTNKGKGERFEKSKYIGETLADSAKVIISKLEYLKTVELSLLSVQIEVPKLQMIRVSDNLTLSPWVGKKLSPPINSIYLQGLRINNFIWTTVPYELSGEYAIDLKNSLELQGYNSVFTNFNGQYLGYIVPAKYYYYDTYEARLMGWYGPSMGDYLMELNYKISNSLTKKRL